MPKITVFNFFCLARLSLPWSFGQTAGFCWGFFTMCVHWHFWAVGPVQGRSMKGVEGPLGTRGPQQVLQVGLEGPLGRTEGLGFTNENKP